MNYKKAYEELKKLVIELYDSDEMCDTDIMCLYNFFKTKRLSCDDMKITCDDCEKALFNEFEEKFIDNQISIVDVLRELIQTAVVNEDYATALNLKNLVIKLEAVQ